MANKRATGQTPSLHFEQVSLSALKAKLHDDGLEAQPPMTGAAGTHVYGKTDSAPHFHAVQFYDSPDSLCRIVGGFIGEGLEQGAAAILIVTPNHATRIEECLRQAAFDVDALKRAGRLAIVDARNTLDQFMVDGMPNPGLFRRTVGGLLMETRRSSDSRPIRAYGEMVDLLWKDGREAAAIRLETLWNQLAGHVAFELLCGYSMGNFYKGSLLDEIRRQHTHVVPADGGAAVPVGPASAEA